MKALIFDCFEVLIMSPYAQIYHDFPHHFDELRDLNLRSDYGYIDHETYDREAAAITGLEPQDIRERYWHGAKRNEVLIAWIKAHRSSDHKIGLLSNVGRGWLDDFLPPGERAELFDEVILSNEIHLTKPDPAIFRLMAEKLDVPPSECVMIDDLAKNCEGAELAGMQATQFITNDATISKLKSLSGTEMIDKA